MQFHFDPTLTNGAVALLSVLTLYYIIRVVDMAMHLFTLIRTMFKAEEDMKRLEEMLIETFKNQPPPKD